MTGVMVFFSFVEFLIFKAQTVKADVLFGHEGQGFHNEQQLAQLLSQAYYVQHMKQQEYGNLLQEMEFEKERKSGIILYLYKLVFVKTFFCFQLLLGFSFLSPRYSNSTFRKAVQKSSFVRSSSVPHMLQTVMLVPASLILGLVAKETERKELFLFHYKLSVEQIVFVDVCIK